MYKECQHTYSHKYAACNLLLMLFKKMSIDQLYAFKAQNNQQNYAGDTYNAIYEKNIMVENSNVHLNCEFLTSVTALPFKGCLCLEKK
jgi:hypothetical protein